MQVCCNPLQYVALAQLHACRHEKERGRERERKESALCSLCLLSCLCLSGVCAVCFAVACSVLSWLFSEGNVVISRCFFETRQENTRWYRAKRDGCEERTPRPGKIQRQKKAATRCQKTAKVTNACTLSICLHVCTWTRDKESVRGKDGKSEREFYRCQRFVWDPPSPLSLGLSVLVILSPFALVRVRSGVPGLGRRTPRTSRVRRTAKKAVAEEGKKANGAEGIMLLFNLLSANYE